MRIAAQAQVPRGRAQCAPRSSDRGGIERHARIHSISFEFPVKKMPLRLEIEIELSQKFARAVQQG
jgi:hypothetical protein